jgi:hypothetical protein
MKREENPVFFAQGGYAVPDGKPFGRMVGEIRQQEDGYLALYYPNAKVTQLGKHESFGEALYAFAARRIENREAVMGGATRITQRIRRKAWHVCLLCGLHDASVKLFEFELAKQRLHLCPDCLNELSAADERRDALLHILSQRPEAPDMSGWIKVSERGGFELWHRSNDSGVYVDQFTVVRGKQKWQLGTNGAEMVDTPIDRELREQLPHAYQWAVNQIGRFCLKRQHAMLDNTDGSAL